MKKQSKIIGLIILLLVAAVGILAFLNRESIAEKKELQENQTFNIISNDETYSVNMDIINEIGEKDITVTRDTSTSGPEKVEFTGVPLADIIEHMGIDISGTSSCIFTAVDGYAASVTINEAADPDNIYIVTKEEGKYLGKKEDGGQGPYMMIVAKDQFSLRWCKYLMEVTFK